MMQAVIIHGPQGCGKTRHAKDFCELYGCTAWTDDWLPGEPLMPGLLHLTFEVPSGLPGRDVQIISFDEAMKALGEKIVVRHLGTTTWQGPANQAPEFLGAQPGHNIAPVVSRPSASATGGADMSVPQVNIFGGGWQRAAKEHTCWLCGETIAKGEGYFRTTGTVGGKMFSVKHCRKTCECTAEMLDQNPQLAHRVFEPTFKHEAST